MSRRQADRSIVAPQFGALLTTLRGAHTSRGIICAKLARFGLALDRSTLLQYERGTVASPSPTILWGLAQIYRVPLNDLVVALLRDVSTNRTQLFRHEVEPFTPEQRAIAELSSAMSPKARQALVTLLELLLNEHAEAPAITRTTRPAR
jgi:transcriptional regulator with XRE-family HTH domain